MGPTLLAHSQRPRHGFCSGAQLTMHLTGSPTLMRKVKNVPVELWPLAVVVTFAIGAAGFAIGRKFVVDKNLRLARQGAAGRDDHGEHH
jgi:hypothetical protein